MPGESVAWRLIGANNRELGRADGSAAAAADCEMLVRVMVESLPLARISMRADIDVGGWNWRIFDGDAALARAGRSYQRQRECQYNLAQFLAAAPGAVNEEMRITRPAPRSRSRDVRGLRAVHVSFGREEMAGHEAQPAWGS